MSHKAKAVLAASAIIIIFICEVVAVILNQPWHRSVIIMGSVATSAITIWSVQRNTT
jgi:hypothetical protein